MKPGSKSVALLLVLVILALPGTATWLCASPLVAAAHCTPCCPSTTWHPVQPVVKATPPPAPCCDISSGKPAPRAAWDTAQAPSTQMAAPGLVEAPSMPAPQQPPQPDTSPSPQRSACPHALFCSFLI